ncbi:OLC1v1001955C1 [Oldenlandia corymbosa var. corymbosa]|uniref:OLC1v1001955C1 n=1 Tax=Oldenlandia corymbosa var. corymbosa TaxID=529605 RepID=A0AAV1D9F2_OLDCO|nr:OLC1v1001955C1 [Oldenlandia corymbosa var. corymbosa]
MAMSFAKPENALKRAEELLNVGQKQGAWDTIHCVITSRRYRAWTKTLERVMFKYIDLCVEMRKGAKEGLNQYRIMCQQVNVSSLGEIIKHFIYLSTERAEFARNKADALEEALDIDDLEADTRPEDLMLSYVSGQKGKDRSDRELVTPWFKFLWETYRTVLEVLRNNSKLESLYAPSGRGWNFGQLQDALLNHLVNLNKYKDQKDRPDISAPESLQLYLDTRFEQPKIATELELWQEAFCSVEHIHGLMCIVEKQPKPSLLVIYYTKLTEIFRMSSSHLHHAYAWFKLFSLQKSFNKNLTQKDLQLIASSVVLAGFSVPYDLSRGSSHLELENGNRRNLRRANLIGFSIDDTLEELVSKGVLTCATQDVKDLYHLLEHEFLPLDLASKVQPLLVKVLKIGGKLSSASSLPEVQLSQYTPALEKLAALLKQLNNSLSNRNVLSYFYNASYNFDNYSILPLLEKISAEAVKFNFLSLKIDHGKGAVVFNSQDFEADKRRKQLNIKQKTVTNAAETTPAPAKYVPKFKMQLDNSRQASASVSDRWGSGRSDERQPSDRPCGYGFGSGASARSKSQNLNETRVLNQLPQASKQACNKSVLLEELLTKERLAHLNLLEQLPLEKYKSLKENQYTGKTQKVEYARKRKDKKSTSAMARGMKKKSKAAVNEHQEQPKDERKLHTIDCVNNLAKDQEQPIVFEWKPIQCLNYGRQTIPGLKDNTEKMSERIEKEIPEEAEKNVALKTKGDEVLIQNQKGMKVKLKDKWIQEVDINSKLMPLALHPASDLKTVKVIKSVLNHFEAVTGLSFPMKYLVSYNKSQNWWEYKPPQDNSWHWKKIKIKEVFAPGIVNGKWQNNGGKEYTATSGYRWLRGDQHKFQPARVVWTSVGLPKHNFISWMAWHDRILTVERLQKMTIHIENLEGLEVLAEHQKRDQDSECRQFD